MKIMCDVYVWMVTWMVTWMVVLYIHSYQQNFLGGKTVMSAFVIDHFCNLRSNEQVPTIVDNVFFPYTPKYCSCLEIP